MTFEELKTLVLADARRYRDDADEEDGREYEDTAKLIDLYAAVGACRIVRRDENFSVYVWILDDPPRRAADERLWAALNQPHMLDGDRFIKAICDHRDAIQAINGVKAE